VLKGFREFVLRGNVVDLAVAVVIGTAFTAVVTATTKDLITPIIAAFGGQPDFSGLTFTINGSRFLYGEFIDAVITFLILAAIVYFLVVVPINKLQERRVKPAEDVSTRECPECLSTIPRAAKRCSFCTSLLTPAA
jgi:large conductance mechanosensitive channel